jgi:hypothetical protein
MKLASPTFESLKGVLGGRPELLAVGGLLIFCSLFFLSSESVRYGDAVVYAADLRLGALIEPGHLIWRPLGRVVGSALWPSPAYSDVLWVLQILCLVASLSAVCAMFFLARSLCGWPVAFFVSILMAISNGFWAYSFSGCSYSLGVLFQIMSLRYAVSNRGIAATPVTACIAGAYGGLSAAAWGLESLAAPAIWLAVMLTSVKNGNTVGRQIRATVGLSIGYVFAFFLPLLVAFFFRSHLQSEALTGAGSGGVRFLDWLSSARHGIPARFGVTQIFRVVIGWPQSVLSTSNIGQDLRLWHFREAGFPWSLWLGGLAAFYAALGTCGLVLVRAYPRLTTTERSLIVVCVAAIATNLLFAVSWQGTDLERYFPSLPFQLTLIALSLKCMTEGGRQSSAIPLGVAVLLAVVLVNWFGTFLPILGSGSYRQTWIRELHSVASGNDLVIVLGQRKLVVLAPHDSRLPHIDNLSNEIVMRGDGWRAAELQNIETTMQRGGRVFLGDSLFGADTAARDGWSFFEYPRPTPSDIQEAFRRFKSNRVAFVIMGEKFWVAN